MAAPTSETLESRWVFRVLVAELHQLAFGHSFELFSGLSPSRNSLVLSNQAVSSSREDPGHMLVTWQVYTCQSTALVRMNQ